MSRFTGPKGKIVRRFKSNIYGNPKYDRLLSKKPNPPGIHGPNQGRKKLSEYGEQLIEKQKIKYTYGMREKQFRILFSIASRQKGITGDNLLILLESRLDNAVFRSGLAATRDQARQLISHGHLKVNDRKVNVASYRIKEGDKISVKDSVRSKALIQRMSEENASRPASEWIAVDKNNLTAEIIRLPIREEIQSPGNEQLVVELYSK